MQELQKKNDADLTTFIDEKREELRVLRFSASGSGVRNTRAAANLRTEIARSLTERSRRKQEEAANA